MKIAAGTIKPVDPEKGLPLLGSAFLMNGRCDAAPLKATRSCLGRLGGAQEVGLLREGQRVGEVPLHDVRAVLLAAVVRTLLDDQSEN